MDGDECWCIVVEIAFAVCFADCNSVVFRSGVPAGTIEPVVRGSEESLVLDIAASAFLQLM